LKPLKATGNSSLMKKIVILTGAGISAESGIRTFRDSDGLWCDHRIEDVASPYGWEKDPQMVLDFYNLRRKELHTVHPNPGHLALVELEKAFHVNIITQNVDDLHERAGSSNVLHLHGELKKVRSTCDPDLVYELDGWELKMGDTCEKGSQLRPHIVWFGEGVPNILHATSLVRQADIFLIIGTSLKVYPAAGLLQYAKSNTTKFLVDPAAEPEYYVPNLTIIREKAASGVPALVKSLIGKEI
jgi:NAD-dependent deacetylase